MKFEKRIIMIVMMMIMIMIMMIMAMMIMTMMMLMMMTVMFLFSNEIISHVLWTDFHLSRHPGQYFVMTQGECLT